MRPALIFDIETIPDLSSARKLYDLGDLSDDEVFAATIQLRREKVGHDFLPHHLQQIVAISLVYAENNNIRVWSLGDEKSSEKELLERFFTGIDKYTPQLISWNGSGFDLPVIHYRSLLHAVAAPTYWEVGEQETEFKWNNYLNRYHYRHLDLMDLLALYQNKAFAPLDEIATMLGFPGKMGMSGSKVYTQYKAGDLSSIRNYCETDVLNTYCIYLRFELIRGKLSKDKYSAHMENLHAYLLNDATKSHLCEFAQKMMVFT